MAKTEQGNGLDVRDSTEKLTDNGRGSSPRSDPEVNGTIPAETEVDKYGFTGGAQQNSRNLAEEVPPEVLRQREAKWLEMLNSWDKWMAKKHNKVKERCQKGIPPSLRGRAWLYLTGAKVKREQNQGRFEELDNQSGDPKWVDVIERDLHRQFPFHEMFAARGGHGQQDLFRVLKAYSLYRPEEGYCQAQAPIAAVLLMHMPAEDAFWVLVQICEKYLPGYYSTGLEAIQLDGEILEALLRRVSAVAYRHVKKHKLEPVLYMTEWFMCAFSRTLPWASVLRVWDMFLCEGVKIFFRVGLVLLKCMLGTQDKLKTCQGLYETVELLRTIQPQYMQESFLVHEVLVLPVSEKDIEKEHLTQLRRWKETHGDLQCKSPPRMHGAKAIMSAEPPSRQDLKQRPTIIVESPLASKTDGVQTEETKGTRKTKEGNGHRRALPPLEVVNPYAPVTDPPPLREPEATRGSRESLSSAEHDTYL
ncbi:TBC1 domain family member 10A-like [Menidia menidia]